MSKRLDRKQQRQDREFRMSLSWVISTAVFLSLLVMVALSGVVMYVFRNRLPGLSGANNPLIFFYVAAIFSLLVGTVASFFIGIPILRPVNRLVNAMNRLAKGDFKVRMDKDYPANRLSIVSEVTESFNTMAEELEGTEMLRSDFINNFSHEFKTPIVSITGFASLLRQGNLSEEEQQEYLAIIESESRRLSDMATNVLNMSRIEKQTILTDVKTYNLSEQLRFCVLMLENKWNRKNLELDLDFEEHTFSGNEELMKQVWINLLDNAIKFTPEGGMVKIRVRLRPGTLTVAITNTGSEIPEEAKERIFRKFYQADESHQTEGNGIGLAIVKYVVDLHKGSIQVESQNMVTTFSVTLPV